MPAYGDGGVLPPASLRIALTWRPPSVLDSGGVFSGSLDADDIRALFS